MRTRRTSFVSAIQRQIDPRSSSLGPAVVGVVAMVFMAGCSTATSDSAEPREGTLSAPGAAVNVDAGTETSTSTVGSDSSAPSEAMTEEEGGGDEGSTDDVTKQDAGTPAASRWPNSGDYAEWYGGSIPNLPYVVGGQIEIQWSDLDKTAGYDWTPLDTALAALTKPTTLQINGSTKPTYVYEQVPYADMAPCTNWAKDVEVGDTDPQHDGCPRVPMYWHPKFQSIYTKFLAALGAHLHGSPAGSKVIALRQNWNAIGTEHLGVPTEFQSASAWTVPSGATKGPDWSASEQYTFEGNILDAHVTSFFVGGKASPPVFVRSSLESQVLAETAPSGGTYESLFDDGKLAWFMTSAEMEPRTGGAGAYEPFLTYSATGKTLGLAEPWANAWGIHSGINDGHWASPPQFLYWRMLSDMQLGISYVDCYGDDLDVALTGKYQGNAVPEYQAEFNAAFQFASKYAGYAGRPGAAPGAFIAFRPVDPAVKGYTVADYAEFVTLKNPDATKGIDARTSVKGESIAAPYGVAGNTYHSLGPSTQRFGGWARSVAQGSAAELALDATFRTRENMQATKLVHVTYLDDVSGHKFEIAAAGQTLAVTLKGTGTWQTATIQTTKNLAPDSSGADIVLSATSGTITFHMVETTY